MERCPQWEKVGFNQKNKSDGMCASIEGSKEMLSVTEISMIYSVVSIDRPRFWIVLLVVWQIESISQRLHVMAIQRRVECNKNGGVGSRTVFHIDSRPALSLLCRPSR